MQITKLLIAVNGKSKINLDLINQLLDSLNFNSCQSRALLNGTVAVTLSLLKSPLGWFGHSNWQLCDHKLLIRSQDHYYTSCFLTSMCVYVLLSFIFSVRWPRVPWKVPLKKIYYYFALLFTNITYICVCAKLRQVDLFELLVFPSHRVLPTSITQTFQEHGLAHRDLLLCGTFHRGRDTTVWLW